MGTQAPPPQASLWAMCLTFEMSAQVHRVPGVVSVEVDPLPAPSRIAGFLVDHTPWQVSHPRKGRVTREELRFQG